MSGPNSKPGPSEPGPDPGSLGPAAGSAAGSRTDLTDPSAAAPPYFLTRLVLQRALAFIYLTVFWGTAHQHRSLIGERGLLPAGAFLDRIDFWSSPGLFWISASDPFISAVAWAGVVLSGLALTGITERFGPWISAAAWTSLWLFHLSFVNAGQTFYSFGWEIMTLEAGFLAIFLGSRDTRPPAAVIWLYRWLVFRLMFGAGLIKLRGDACWRDLTCMDYHYETQPIPNPLSWFFHHLPAWYHRTEVLFTHFVEVVVPWGLLSPWRRPRIAAAALTIAFQTALIVSGNLSWLNYLTIAVTLACLDDNVCRMFVRTDAGLGSAPRRTGLARRIVIGTLTALILFLSAGPVQNLFSPRQAMNRSFDPLHLVNTYGAFGTVTKVRHEIVLEGTDDERIGPGTVWKEYGFKAKPGDVSQMPPVISPQQLRLDWLMWFAAMGDWRRYPWILTLSARLLQNDPETIKQIAHNPFPGAPPAHLRAVIYRYRFTSPEERRRTGAWWTREPAGQYLPPLSLKNPSFLEILARLGWKS